VFLGLCGPKSHARYFTTFPVGKLVFNYARSPGRRSSQTIATALWLSSLHMPITGHKQPVFISAAGIRGGGGAEHNVNISFCINPLYVPFVVRWTKYIAPSLTVDLMDQVRYGESIDSVCA